MYHHIGCTFGQPSPLFGELVDKSVKFFKVGLGKCVHCEEKSFGRQEVILQYPKFVLRSDQTCFNSLKGIFECIMYKLERFFIIEAYYGGPTLVEEPLETLEARETPLEAVQGAEGTKIDRPEARKLRLKENFPT